MGALGKPRPGHWLAVAFVVSAAALGAPAAAIAQSSEITKTLPRQPSGQTEIRKSAPGAAPREQPRERVEQPAQERPVEAVPVEAREAKSQRATLLPTLEWPTDVASQGVTVTQADVTKAGALTRFSMLLSARVPYHVSYLANPYRVVLDTPDVTFQLPVTAGRQGQGLIRAYRYGLFAPGKARVVIDTAQPVRVQKQAMNVDPAGGGARLILDLAPTDEESFLASIAPPPAAARHHAPQGDDARPEPRAANARPVIVIDPGHGGPDPGASGPGFYEKEVVLEVAHQVRAALEALGRFDVEMTRTTDVFIPLPDRVAFSRRNRASLFVSIHANSVPAESTRAAIVRGAAVYTLSEEASTREAQRLAEQENAADLQAGVESRLEEVNEVDRILSDLKWRETSEFSANFRGRLITHLKRATTLSREPAPSAAFMVLRQSESPSVLIELGYISNAKDAQLLVEPDWQRKVAQSIAIAIDEYFVTRSRRP
jgi:N-acetylmuramoyl-L-alanine amidase